MVTIAAVNVGNYRGMGTRYVNALYRGRAKNLAIPFRFVCFTEETRQGLDPAVEARTPHPGLDGWYNKLALFEPGTFCTGERIFYLDLDTIILTNIDDIASYSGPLAMLGDFRAPSLRGSGVMAWEAGQYDFIWHQWVASGYPKRISGDQAWIAELVPNAVVWQTLFPGRLLSIKTECTGSEARTRWQNRWCAVKAQFFQLPYPEGGEHRLFPRTAKARQLPLEVGARGLEHVEPRSRVRSGRITCHGRSPVKRDSDVFHV